MKFKDENIDSLAKRFNEVDKNIRETIRILVETWEHEELYPVVSKLKVHFDDFKGNLKALFVEFRQNILLLNQEEKIIYGKYCQITLRGLNEPIEPKTVEQALYKAFGEGILTFEDSYYNADMAVTRDISYYEASNYIFCFSLLMNYYYSLLIRITDNIVGATVEDEELNSLDKDKNTINQKALLLYYLVKEKKINMNKISQDTTKQAKIFSFLFDNGYENVRKSLGFIQESGSGKLKNIGNLTKISTLISSLGPEFKSIKNTIEQDIDALVRTSKKNQG